MKAIVPTRPQLAALILGLTLIAVALSTAIALHYRAQVTIVPLHTTAELAYVQEMGEVMAADVDPVGALAGGYNACYWLGEYGIDPVTLAGWDSYWSQPWEREWLAAAVRHLCPPQ